MKNQDVLAVKKILQECSEQCNQNVICIPYFRRLKENIAKENIDEVFSIIITEATQNIIEKLHTNTWLLYELENQFSSQPIPVELAKNLTISLIDSMKKKDKTITFKSIRQSLPKWLNKNDRDLVLGSIIHFLFYLDQFVSV